MSESAPAGPVLSNEEAPGGGWMHFVFPQPHAIHLHDAKRLLRRLAGETGAWAVVVAVAAALLAPVLAFAIAGGWALYTYIATLLTLWRNVKAYQLNNLTPLLHALDMAARVAVASAGYFALLAALIVLMAGLLGKRWRRLFLFPGLTFTLPSALAFFFGLRLSLDAFAAPLGMSAPVQTALLVYLLLDTILLAAALVDVSPRRRRTHRAHRPHRPRWLPLSRRRTPSAPLTPLHFGPSAPPAAESVKIVPVLTSTAECVVAQQEPISVAQIRDICQNDETKIDAPASQRGTICADTVPAASDDSLDTTIGVQPAAPAAV